MVLWIQTAGKSREKPVLVQKELQVFKLDFGISFFLKEKKNLPQY